MDKYFAYLEKLRQSSITNMYGARPYLQREFPELAGDPQRTSEILRGWMDSHRKEGGEVQ